MAWTAKLISKAKDPANPQNIRVVVEFTDGTETITQTTFGTTLTLGYLKGWVRQVIATLNERDSTLSTLPEPNTTITPGVAPDTTAAATFQQRLRKLLTLKQINSSDAAIVSAQATLQTQVETYIKANPDAI